MESSIFAILIPLVLGTIMFGLGLSLSPEDFKRILLYPKAAFIGLVCQMFILPVLCFFIATLFELPPVLAVGLMLLSASPGGAAANLYSHLANGDVALNISLTAINSVLTLFTLPFIVSFSIGHFMNAGDVIPMPFNEVAEVFAIVLIPVALGMMLKPKLPKRSENMEKYGKIVPAIFLIAMIIGILIKERAKLSGSIGQISLAVLSLNLISMIVGYFIPKLFKLEKKQAIAIGMEIGIHNCVLAIFIASSVLKNDEMTFPAAIYSIVMFFTAALFGVIVNIGNKKAEKI
jgi:bile acid:Na+ symporter, BASS family